MPKDRSTTRFRVRLETPDGRRHALRVGAQETILEAALRNGLDLPYRCLRGWCLTCAARLIEGRVSQELSVRYFEADRRHGFALICTGRPETDLVLVTHAREAMRKAREKEGLPFPRGDWGEGEG